MDQALRSQSPGRQQGVRIRFDRYLGDRRASALIVAMGMLTVLAIMAFAFAAVARSERQVARNYTDQVRARMYAQSGVDAAVSEIQAAISPDVSSMTQAEKDAYSIAEGADKPWYYTGSVDKGRTTPIEEATQVSFQKDTVVINNRQSADAANDFGVSGFLPGTHVARGDFYAVKVVDSCGKVYINGADDPGSTTYTPLSDSWKSLLDTLGQVLVDTGVQCPHGSGLSNAGIGGRIEGIRSALFGQEGRTPMTLRDLQGDGAPFYGAGGSDAHDFEILAEHLSAQSWVNHDVIRPDRIQHPRDHDPNVVYSPTGQWFASAPVEESAEALAWVDLPHSGDPLLSVDRLGGLRSMLRSLPGAQALLGGVGILPSCGSDRLFNDEPSSSGYHSGNDHFSQYTLSNEAKAPTQSGDWDPDLLDPRAPVNINSAPLAVLRAVLQTLRGTYVRRADYAPSNNWNNNTSWGSTNVANVMGRGYTPAYEVSISPALATYVANEIVTRRLADPFDTHWDFDRFIDGLNGAAFSGNAEVRGVEKRILKSNANPNSHLSSFNPDRYLDAGRFGDPTKVDLRRWSTEFCFRSNGYFEIESLGRVLGSPDPSGNSGVVAEAKVVAIIKVYDVYKHSTQAQFVEDQASAAGPDPVTTYPENIGDVGAGMAAKWDGFMMITTVDNDANWNPGATMFQREFLDGFGTDAMGTAEDSRSLIFSSQAGTASDRGPQSELFPDGLFCHETRRYPTYEPRRLYGYDGVPVDDFLRYRNATSKINLNDGGVGMWVKPTWVPTDYETDYYGAGHQCLVDPGPPGDNSVTHWHPEGESTRAFVSVGQGMEHGDGHASANRRMVVGARQVVNGVYHSNVPANMRGFYIVGFHGDSTVPWTGSVPWGNLFWNDIVPHWGWVVHAAYPVDTTSAAANNPENPYSWNYAGNWHYVTFSWSGRNSEILVDGRGHQYARLSAFNLDSSILSDDSLFIGNNRFKENRTGGFPCNADATIDAFTVWSSTGQVPDEGNPPHRYLATGTYEGDIVNAALAAGSRGGRVANVAWTAYFPDYETQTDASMFIEVKTGASSSGVISAGTTSAPPPGYSAPKEAARAGDGYPLEVVLGAGQTLQYRVELRQDGNWLVGSPVLDDITVAVVPPSVTFLYYHFD